MEAGVHSIWISDQLEQLGHEVIVANVRELRAISHSDRKSDDVDAEKLARYARLDPEILRPISHRTVEQQEAPYRDSRSRASRPTADGGRERVSSKSADRVRQPYPATTGSRLRASTVGPALGC
jgi:hypothetical protein